MSANMQLVYLYDGGAGTPAGLSAPLGVSAVQPLMYVWCVASPTPSEQIPVAFQTAKKSLETSTESQENTRGEPKKRMALRGAPQNSKIAPDPSFSKSQSRVAKVDQKAGRKKPVCQNPKRNIITNIGNQLITFISSRKKSEATLRRIEPQWTQAEIVEYYHFASRVKQQSEYYLNIDKIRKMWYSKADGPVVARRRQALRKLSLFHLNNVLPSSVLNSRKMKTDSKLLHLRARRVMIQQLRNPRQRYAFI